MRKTELIMSFTNANPLVVTLWIAALNGSHRVHLDSAERASASTERKQGEQ